MAAMTAQAMKGREDDLDKALVPQGAKASGAIRVGVAQINNKTEHAISADALRARLMAEIQGNGLEAVPLNAISASEAQPEAKAKQCDFILFTDIAALKT